MNSRNKGMGGSTFTANQRRPSLVALLEKRIVALEETIRLIADWVKFDKTKLPPSSSFKELPRLDSVNPSSVDTPPGNSGNAVVKSVGRRTKKNKKEITVVSLSDESTNEDLEDGSNLSLGDEVVNISPTPDPPLCDASSPEDFHDGDGEVGEASDDNNDNQEVGIQDFRSRENDVGRMNPFVKLERMVGEEHQFKTKQDSRIEVEKVEENKVSRKLESVVSIGDKESEVCKPFDPRMEKLMKATLKCDVCELCFHSKRALNDHKVRDHNWSREHQCPYCPKKVSHFGHFMTHVRTHSDETPYLCSVCGKALKTASSLKTHAELHSGTESVMMNVCKYCGKQFKSYNSCKFHERIHEGKMEQTCPQCNGSYTNLKLHIRTVHDKIRKYECHLCDRKFKRTSHLKRHVATHSNPNRRIKGYHIERPDRPKQVRKRLVLRMNVDSTESAQSGPLDKNTLGEGMKDNVEIETDLDNFSKAPPVEDAAGTEIIENDDGDGIIIVTETDAVELETM